MFAVRRPIVGVQTGSPRLEPRQVATRPLRLTHGLPRPFRSGRRSDLQAYAWRSAETAGAPGHPHRRPPATRKWSILATLPAKTPRGARTEAASQAIAEPSKPWPMPRAPAIRSVSINALGPCVGATPKRGTDHDACRGPRNRAQARYSLKP